jgi:hypothetical protein
MDIVTLLWAVFTLVILLVIIWGAVWVLQTYVVGQAPFIPDQFKQVINWVILVVAVIISFIAAIDFVQTLGGGGHTILFPQRIR